MGNINAWICACERERGAGNKCEHCRHAIVNDFRIICANTMANAKRNSVGDKYD